MPPYNDKKLKSNPIIPPNLYVTRSADRQVRRIIDDMGRPGYVLVARQMGKTNLLLNAKRELEGSEDCFLYLDVSNIFPDITGFFRNIIDTAIDAYPEHLAQAAQKIRERRKTNMLPHKEHELELRDILRSINGKMIVCLDEIDALTKTDYSDNVFSFLRSIYFSGRINFPEFSRLTYILSGVAEPKSLIKNRDVSPFNIGEKILLDNFSTVEFENFIDKAGLSFPVEVTERIYYWMNGNPRMTWDICSKLEDAQSDGTQIRVEVVDKIIRELYLTNFDVPPVDHLRTLAEDDKDVRQALMSIHYGKASSISDSVKAKLYLHGFVSISGADQTVKIKNLVIEESLSESWLQDVELRKTSLIERADKKMHAGEFQDALSLFAEYVDSAGVGSNLNPIFFSMGRCCIEISKAADALELFEKVNFDKNEEPRMWLAQRYHKGVCLRKLNRYFEAVDVLNDVLYEGERLNIKKYHFDASILLSSVYLALNEDSKVVEITTSIITSEPEVRKIAADSRHANDLMFAAYFNGSLALESLGRVGEARDKLISALALSDDQSKVGILLNIAKLGNSDFPPQKYYTDSLNHIIGNRLPVVAKRADRPLDLNTENFIKLLSGLNIAKDDIGFNKLADHLFDSSVTHYMPSIDVVYSAIFGAISNSDRKVAVALIEKALTSSELEPTSDKHRGLITLGMILKPFDEISLLEKTYFEEYLHGDGARLIESDYRLCYGLVRGYLDQGNTVRASEILHIFNQLLANEYSYVSNGSVAVMRFLDILVTSKTGRDPAALIQALKGFLGETPKIDTPLYFADSIFDDMGRLIGGNSNKYICQPFRRTEGKIGRNDRVTIKLTDGQLLTDKYKRLEKYLTTGEGVLISDNT